MEPISILLGMSGNGTLATVSNLSPNSLTGIVSGQGTPSSFSFTKGGPLGNTFSMGGKSFSLKPDFISSVPIGRSFSVFQGLSKIGSISQAFGSNGLSTSSQLGSQMGTAMGTSLRSAGLL